MPWSARSPPSTPTPRALALTGVQDPEALKAFPDDERARLETALGYLCLDLGIEPLAALHFGEVPASTASHPQAQAGLAILSVRRGNSRQALVHFVAARVTGGRIRRLPSSSANTRYQVVLHEFATARDLRDANAAGRAYSVLDELRPHHPATLQARADLAALRGDMPARERALRDLLNVDPTAPGAASELADTLLALNRPYDAYDVARRMAPERLARDAALQAIERDWIPHFEAALDGAWRSGRPSMTASTCRACGSPGPAAARTGAGFGVACAKRPIRNPTVFPPASRSGRQSRCPRCPIRSPTRGSAALVQWAPRNGLLLEPGTTPTSFDVTNLIGALRFRFDSTAGTVGMGVERTPVEDSLLSYAGSVDPVDGRTWGGVVRDRAYLGGRFGDDALDLFG